jgi:aspartate dehydrogenase
MAQEVRSMKRIGLLGCGAIGSVIAGHKTRVDIAALYDRLPARAQRVSAVAGEANTHADFDSFIRDDFEIVVEAASIGAVQDHAEEILRQGKDLIILSVGVLADTAFKQRLEHLAGSLARTIRIPSGALFGLDNLKVGRISRFDRLILRTTKPPASLGKDVKQRTLLFKGGAQEGIRRYPRNVNVAVALSLAAETPVELELWADPGVTRNTHEVIVAGEFGESVITVQNVPSSDNPATSYLAALSILTLLDDLDRPLSIGT